MKSNAVSVPTRLGTWGRREYVEPLVREIVADGLGVPADQLTPEVSLTDDLAADSLDVLDLALALEARFDVALSEEQLTVVRTYADLVDLIVDGTRSRPADHGAGVFVRATVLPAPGARSRAIQRATWLTPYATEVIAADAVQAGRGARLEMSVSSVDPLALDGVRGAFGWLTERGIELALTVERTQRERSARRGAAA